MKFSCGYYFQDQVGRFLDDVTSSGHHTTKINRFVCVREASPPLFLFRCFLLGADIQRVCFRLSRLLFSDDFSSFRMRFSGFHFLSKVQIIKRCGFVVYPTNGRPPRTNQHAHTCRQYRPVCRSRPEPACGARRGP